MAFLVLFLQLTVLFHHCINARNVRSLLQNRRKLLSFTPPSELRGFVKLISCGIIDNKLVSTHHGFPNNPTVRRSHPKLVGNGRMVDDKWIFTTPISDKGVIAPSELMSVKRHCILKISPDILQNTAYRESMMINKYWAWGFFSPDYTIFFGGDAATRLDLIPHDDAPLTDDWKNDPDIWSQPKYGAKMQKTKEKKTQYTYRYRYEDDYEEDEEDDEDDGVEDDGTDVEDSVNQALYDALEGCLSQYEDERRLYDNCEVLFRIGIIPMEYVVGWYRLEKAIEIKSIEFEWNTVFP